MHIYEGQWEQYIFLVLYVDDILLATNDIGLLVETKQLLFRHFDMKDLGGNILCLRLM